MQNKKLFIILIIILIFLFLLRLFQASSPKPTPTPIPTIFIFPSTPTPTPISTPTETPSTSLENIISQLPITNPKYTIEYAANIQKFIVVILQDPYEENKNIVGEWFKEQGVEDLSKINIRFVTARGVAP